MESLPFNIVSSSAFRKFLNQIDPAFVMPSNKYIKTIITEEYNKGVKNLKSYLNNTCEYISITTDLWTAKSKRGYIGITGHWLTEDFKPIYALLRLEKISYPHTGNSISEMIKETIIDYSLGNNFICMTTDNGSNMVLASKLLNETFSKLQRLKCTAHTLQLTVNIALKAIKTQTKKYRRLVKYFSTPKQVEQLEKAQQDLNKTTYIGNYDNSNIDENEDESGDEDKPSYPRMIRNITEIKTRWNSKYHSWKRLAKLKNAVKWIAATLPLSSNRQDKLDGEKLNQILISDEEWDLLNQLIEIFKPFDEMTTYFSGANYATISSILPLIESLKEYYKGLSEKHHINDDDVIDEEVFEQLENNENMTSDFGSDCESDIDSTDENDGELISSIQNMNNNQQNIVDLFKKRLINIIYQSLLHYWGKPNIYALIATILDPRYKDLSFLEDDLKGEAELELRKLYDNLKELINESSSMEFNTDNQETTNPNSSVLFNTMFKLRKKPNMVQNKDEIDKYLDDSITPIVDDNLDIYQWWNDHKHKFPILSRLARMFLAIPATSVASERLFSDAGNNITIKRTSLSTNIVKKLMFLRQNNGVVNVFI
jgi:hypothetical protein